MSSTIRPGQVILDRFRVDAYLNEGTIYRVWDLKYKISLAMKVVDKDLEDCVAYKSLMREGRALQKLTHPHIVPFYGFDRTEDFIFLREWFIDGLTLKQIMRRQVGQPLDVQETLIYLKAISAALGFAHYNDVVYCNVEPGNVMVDLGGKIYLIDFGNVCYLGRAHTTIKPSTAIAYMAPELVDGDPVTAATDIYSLGYMLHEILTGQKPISGEDSILYRRSRVPVPVSINPNLPEALGQVLVKALNKDPLKRYDNTQTLLVEACAALGLKPEMLPDRLPPPLAEDATT